MLGAVNGGNPTALVRTIPFPYKGLNLRDQLKESKPEYAIVLDNIIPDNGEGTLRNGFSAHATGLPAGEDIETLIPYSGGNISELFAAAGTGIFEVTATGAVGAAAVSGFTSARFSQTMFSTTGGLFKIIANGEDPVQHYNGLAWAEPTITGVSSNDLSVVTTHKGRVWFIEKNTLTLWYLDTNAVAGAATAFPLGPLCKKGGSLVAMSTWSHDAGSGPDDFFVIVTSNGEVLIYSGTDPDTDYQHVGTFNIDRPLGGDRCLDRDGGDLSIQTESGPVMCSELISARDPTEIGYSELVRPGVKGDAVRFKQNFGWQTFKYTARGWMIFNVPYESEGEIARQWINNDGAWFRCRNMPARCWAELDGVLYFGGREVVYRADDPNADGDAGQPVVADIQWAWSSFGTSLRKRFTNARPHILSDVTPNLLCEMRTDYGQFSPTNVPTVTDGEGATWDESEWDETSWAGAFFIFSPLVGLFGIGSVGALRIQIRKTVSSLFKIQSCDIAFERGSFL